MSACSGTIGSTPQGGCMGGMRLPQRPSACPRPRHPSMSRETQGHGASGRKQAHVGEQAQPRQRMFSLSRRLADQPKFSLESLSYVPRVQPSRISYLCAVLCSQWTVPLLGSASHPSSPAFPVHPHFFHSPFVKPAFAGCTHCGRWRVRARATASSPPSPLLHQLAKPEGRGAVIVTCTKAWGRALTAGAGERWWPKERKLTLSHRPIRTLIGTGRGGVLDPPTPRPQAGQPAQLSGTIGVNQGFMCWRADEMPEIPRIGKGEQALALAVHWRQQRRRGRRQRRKVRMRHARWPVGFCHVFEGALLAEIMT